MLDLSVEMSRLAAALRLDGDVAGGRARVVQFAAAKGGVGVSAVARAFALKAAERARRAVWLVELDILAGAQHAAFCDQPDVYGALGEPARASPSTAMFFDVEPARAEWPDVRYLAAYRAGVRRLWVTRFRSEALDPGQTVRLVGAPDYWDALRSHADVVVVDAPAAARSSAAEVMAPFMDETVIVAAGDRRDDGGVQRLSDTLHRAGGRVAGVVLNRAPEEPPAFLRMQARR